MRDEFGNELVSGDLIVVRDHVSELDTWIYTNGTLRGSGELWFLDTTEGRSRQLYPIDFITLAQPYPNRNLYGYRKGI